MFDLEIFSPGEYKPAFPVIIPHVTGSVDSLEFASSDRIHDKLLFRLLFVFVISMCK